MLLLEDPYKPRSNALTDEQLPKIYSTLIIEAMDNKAYWQKALHHNHLLNKNKEPILAGQEPEWTQTPSR